MFVRATTLPSFTQTTCVFLDIYSALSFIQISTLVAAERRCLLHYADIYRPYGDPGLRLTWDTTTVRTTVRIAIGFLCFGQLQLLGPGYRRLSQCLGIDEIFAKEGLLTFSREAIFFSDNSEPSRQNMNVPQAGDPQAFLNSAFSLCWLIDKLRSNRRNGHALFSQQDIASMRQTHWQQRSSAMRTSMLKQCPHTCWAMIEDDCYKGTCVLPPFHDGSHM